MSIVTRGLGSNKVITQGYGPEEEVAHRIMSRRRRRFMLIGSLRLPFITWLYFRIMIMKQE